MLQARERVLLYTEQSILNKKEQKATSVGWLLFISKINEKKPFRTCNLVIFQHQSS